MTELEGATIDHAELPRPREGAQGVVKTFVLVAAGSVMFYLYLSSKTATRKNSCWSPEEIINAEVNGVEPDGSRPFPGGIAPTLLAQSISELDHCRFRVRLKLQVPPYGQVQDLDFIGIYRRGEHQRYEN